MKWTEANIAMLSDIMDSCKWEDRYLSDHEAFLVDTFVARVRDVTCLSAPL